MAWFLVQGYPVPASGNRPDNTLPGGGNYPDNTLPGPQPIPGWPTVPGWGGSLPGGQPGYPSHPIYNPPYPDQGLPPFPSHPIAPGGPGQRPPGIWGPTDPRPQPPIYIPITPPPDSGLSPEHPIYIPVYPDQGLPGSQPRPDNTLPGQQPYPDQGLPGGSNQAATIAKIKKVMEFWTGNLPPGPTTPPVPTPVAPPPV